MHLMSKILHSFPHLWISLALCQRQSCRLHPMKDTVPQFSLINRKVSLRVASWTGSEEWSLTVKDPLSNRILRHKVVVGDIHKSQQSQRTHLRNWNLQMCTFWDQTLKWKAPDCKRPGKVCRETIPALFCKLGNRLSLATLSLTNHTFLCTQPCSVFV